jgi:hypothetical protein
VLFAFNLIDLLLMKPVSKKIKERLVMVMGGDPHRKEGRRGGVMSLLSPVTGTAQIYSETE